MKKIIVTAILLIGLLITSCEVRITQNDYEPVAISNEDRVELYSELLAISEVFGALDGFQSFSFDRYKWDDNRPPVMIVRVDFDQDIYLGVRQFKIESTNIKELKLKTKQLAEEIRDAQERPGS